MISLSSTNHHDAGTSNVSAGLSGKIFDDVENKDEETIQEQETETADESVDFTADVDALVGGEELSEEFRDKAVTIFEAQSPQEFLRKLKR